MRVQLIGHFEPCMTEIYLHIDARMADYMAPHPYELDHVQQIKQSKLEAHGAALMVTSLQDCQILDSTSRATIQYALPLQCISKWNLRRRQQRQQRQQRRRRRQQQQQQKQQKQKQKQKQQQWECAEVAD